ncbi:MAG TPA: DUF4337 domain-containing protein [Azospirillum sp.]|nr:DUF4337 domain-containing protein [Azospirillum sp.]
MSDDVNETIHQAAGGEEEARAPDHKRVAVYVAALALLLTLVHLGGSDADKEVVVANIQASDAFSFYEGKTVRQTEYQLAARALELTALSRTDLTPEQRAAIEREVADYRALAAHYESEPQTGDGRAELLARARGFQAERDEATRRGTYFDMAEGLLQLAIVLASVATAIGVGGLLWLSVACAAVGVLATINGYTLLVALPFL